MNKTININLGGFFFHIDEGAYQKLRHYLDAISRSLSDDPQGKNEIIADIEARISELLSEKIVDAREVVNDGDIEEIIAIMGQPEDYSDTENSYTDSSYSYSRNNTSGKKLFRDGDDKFLGGVASGIAHYFDVDTIWIRLGLLALFFGAGFGILIYIILWILLPEAKTTAEKLQMEGTPVNIDNIEKKIRDGFSSMSDKVRTVAGDVSGKIKEGANEISDKLSNTDFKIKSNTTKSGLQDFIDTLGKIILIFFKVIGKFIGVLLVIIAAAVILSLVIGGFSVGSLEFLNLEGNFVHYPPFFYDAILPKWLLTLFAFTLIGVPFLVLFVLGLRILSSNVRQFNRTTSMTLLGIWIIALLAMIFTGIEYGTSHINYGQSTKKNTLSITKNDTISLMMLNDDSIYYQHNLRRNSDKYEVEINQEEKLYSNNIYVNVEKNNQEEAYIIVQKESRGRNSISANKNALEIDYKYKIDANNIQLDAYFLSNYQNKWKDERVNITVFLPENTTIYFDYSTRNFLYDIDNTTDVYDKDMAKHYFLMTRKGLECIDCEEEREIEEDTSL